MAGAVGELVAEYRAQLRELTYNSKPIITSLTILADENAHASTAIADCICRHILQAAPAHQLPALYLLDSICKNLRRADYRAHFRRQIVPVFTSAYVQAPPAQRQALKHLLRTWNDSAVFDVEALQSIDNELARLDVQPPLPSHSAPLAADPRRRPLPAASPEIHVNPKHRPLSASALSAVLPPPPPILTDATLRRDLSPTASLGALEENGLGPADGPRRKKARVGGKRKPGGGQGRTQDWHPSEVAHTGAAASWTAPPVGQDGALPAPAADWREPLAEAGAPGFFLPLPAPPAAMPPAASAPSAEAFQQAEQLLAALHTLLPPAPPAAATPPLPPGPPPQAPPPLPPSRPPPPHARQATPLLPPAQSPPAFPAIDMQQLAMLSSLLQAQTRTPTPPLPLQPPPSSSGLPPPPPGPPPPAAAAASPLGRSFAPEALRVRHEGVLAALYWAFPHQCKRCGRRFLAREAYSAHLDWHFEQNKRRRERRSSSRPWMAPAAEWGGAPEGPPPAGGNGLDAGTGEEGADPTETQEDDEAVAVPADEEQTTCALCGEALEVFWSVEEDEWMYRGAVYLEDGAGEERGPIVHAKCRSERDTAEDTLEGTAEESAGGEGAHSAQTDPAPSLALLPDVLGVGEAVAGRQGAGEAGVLGKLEVLEDAMAEGGSKRGASEAQGEGGGTAGGEAERNGHGEGREVAQQNGAGLKVEAFGEEMQDPVFEYGPLQT